MKETLEERLRKVREMSEAARRAKPKFRTGDQVMIDVDRMMKKDDYLELSSPYRHFVETNRGRVFTAVYQNGFFGLKEAHASWLFLQDDLIAADSEQ